MNPKAPPLAGLSEEGVLDAILAAVRAMALDDGAAARIARRGYGHFSVEVVIENYRVIHLEAGSKASMKP